MPDRYRSPEQQRQAEQQALATTLMIRPWDVSEVAEELRAMAPEDVQPWRGEAPEEYLGYLRDQPLYQFPFREGEGWLEPVGYMVPSTTGPWWVVGRAELIVEAVGRSTMALQMRAGVLVAIRPQGVALPDPSPDRWRKLLGAAARGRAGMLWLPAAAAAQKPRKGR